MRPVNPQTGRGRKRASKTARGTWTHLRLKDGQFGPVAGHVGRVFCFGFFVMLHAIMV